MKTPMRELITHLQMLKSRVDVADIDSIIEYATNSIEKEKDHIIDFAYGCVQHISREDIEEYYNRTYNQETKHNLDWYKDRVGKRVYRTASTCPCEICKSVEDVGLVIADELHANYLYDCQNDLNLYYFDEPKKNN